MSEAWWSGRERGPVTRGQLALRSAAAFGAVLLTMSISWPLGIAVAIGVCAVATVIANRLIRAGEDDAEAPGDLAALLGMTGSSDS